MDRGRWRIRTNQELYQLCGENAIVKFCKFSRLRWAGHVIRQDDDGLSRRILLSEPGGKRPRGRPRLRWEDGVEEDVARLGCRNWRIVAQTGKDGRNYWRRPRPTPGCSAVGERDPYTVLKFGLSFLWKKEGRLKTVERTWKEETTKLRIHSLCSSFTRAWMIN